MAKLWLAHGWTFHVWFGPSRFFFFFKPACFVYILFICVFLVSSNILNKSLFMQVGITKNLLFFGETTTIFFI